MGAMPPEFDAARAEAPPLLLAEGTSMKASGSLRPPSRRSSGFTSLHSGTLLIMPGRLLASMRRYVLADEWPAGERTDGSVAYRIDAAGLEMIIDIARAVPGGTGQVTVQYRCPIPDSVLNAFPRRQWQGVLAAREPEKALRRI